MRRYVVLAFLVLGLLLFPQRAWGSIVSPRCIATPDVTSLVIPPNSHPAMWTSDQLACYGLPPRPNDAAGLEPWIVAVSHAREYVRPTIQPTHQVSPPIIFQSAYGSSGNASPPTIVQGHKKSLMAFSRRTSQYTVGLGQYSANWTGFDALDTENGVGGHPLQFEEIRSTMTVPSVDAKTAGYELTGFGGIGGAYSNSTTVLQSGIDMTTTGTTGHYHMFFEYYPYEYIEDVYNPTISPGDVIYATTIYTSPPPMSSGWTPVVSWYMVDNTTGQYFAHTNNSAFCVNNVGSSHGCPAGNLPEWNTTEVVSEEQPGKYFGQWVIPYTNVWLHAVYGFAGSNHDVEDWLDGSTVNWAIHNITMENVGFTKYEATTTLGAGLTHGLKTASVVSP